MTTLASLTTIGLGGPAGRLLTVTDEADAIEALSTSRSEVLVLAGGSNVVIADDGFRGTVVRIASRGIERAGDEITVAAGEPWDAFVARCVDLGLAGIECLAGIPGSTGATPIQNVGAYGQDVSERITAVRAYDRSAGEIVSLDPAQCDFTYRSSALKRNRDRWLVLAVTFRLQPQDSSTPIAYAELAKELNVGIGDTAPLADVREAVLRLRARKGMVIDPHDPDSVSVGSFFTNPIVTASELDAVARRAGGTPPAFPEPDGRVKTSAAWLVERAGFRRGYGHGRVGISTKHTLALVNRGGGTARELVALALEIAAGVREAFGIALVPEPVLVGIDWPEDFSNPRVRATSRAARR